MTKSIFNPDYELTPKRGTVTFLTDEKGVFAVVSEYLLPKYYLETAEPSIGARGELRHPLTVAGYKQIFQMPLFAQGDSKPAAGDSRYNHHYQIIAAFSPNDFNSLVDEYNNVEEKHVPLEKILKLFDDQTIRCTHACDIETLKSCSILSFPYLPDGHLLNLKTGLLINEQNYSIETWVKKMSNIVDYDFYHIVMTGLAVILMFPFAILAGFTLLAVVSLITISPVGLGFLAGSAAAVGLAAGAAFFKGVEYKKAGEEIKSAEVKEAIELPSTPLVPAN